MAENFHVSMIDIAQHADEIAEVQRKADTDGFATSSAASVPVLLERSRRINARCFGVSISGKLVGFCYGMKCEERDFWTQCLHRHLTCQRKDKWLSESLIVAEVHVLPPYQGRGIGGKLLSALCRESPYPRSVLTVAEGNVKAQRLYTSLGFVNLSDSFDFPGHPVRLLAMGAEHPLLGLRS
ncbi:GNAT family N-acetyltransferase [Streptomyces sp. 900105245]